MSRDNRMGDLEIRQDLEFQRHMWVVQRIGWAVAAVALVAALLGLFGGAGPLSNATAGDRGAPLSVEEYERFLHYGTPTTLRVHIDAPPGAGKEVRVWLSREYLESVRVQQINPEPESVEAGPDRLTYVFEVDTGAGQPTAFTFDLLPDKIGPLEGRVGLDGANSLTFNQFVYP